ncbi:unnamed protein product, partial [Ectocarpus sp. 8 AP-2014]
GHETKEGVHAYRHNQKQARLSYPRQRRKVPNTSVQSLGKQSNNKIEKRGKFAVFVLDVRSMLNLSQHLFFRTVGFFFLRRWTDSTADTKRRPSLSYKVALASNSFDY